MESVDESGAGDAFAAGLIAALQEGLPLERTLRFAAAVGASSTRAMGCVAGVFTYEEANAFLDGMSMSRYPLNDVRLGGGRWL
jgi:sugar/nucleoside kinase (ribokinase family)